MRSSTSLRGANEVLRSDPGRRFPKPPATLTTAERRLWRALWTGPLGDLWDAVDAPEVERWFSLRRAVEAAPGNGALHGQLSRVAAALGLNPAGRAALGVRFEEVRADLEVAPAGRHRSRPDPRLAPPHGIARKD
jgi:hypothetical protein